MRSQESGTLRKKYEYGSQINEGKINELIEKVQVLTVDDIDMELKQILIEPALKVFPQAKKKLFIKKSNNAFMVGYDSQCWRSRKEYHRARHTYHRHKNTANLNFTIEKSKRYKGNFKRIKNKERTNLVKEFRKKEE